MHGCAIGQLAIVIRIDCKIAVIVDLLLFDKWQQSNKKTSMLVLGHAPPRVRRKVVGTQGKTAMGVMMHLQREARLLEMVTAIGTPSCFTSRLNCRQ